MHRFMTLCFLSAGIIPIMGSANERRRYNVTSFLIGIQNRKTL